MSLRPVVLASALLLIAAACTEAPTEPTADLDLAPAFARGGNSQVKVTGSGHLDDFRFAEPQWRSFSFTASENGGQWQLINRNVPARIHGEVSCVRIIGNEAWFAGPTTVSDRENEIGVNRAFYVVDNGQGSAAAPDQIAFVPPVLDPQAWCDNAAPRAAFDIEAGNIQIH